MQNRFKHSVILIGEDSPDDVFFLRRALKELGCEGQVHAMEDGQEVINYLKGEGKYADREKYGFPEILLLDLKMPRHDGFYVLEFLHEHERCRVVPSIVFSSSVMESDVNRVYKLGGSAYLVKPSGFKELTELLRTTLVFWSTCERPSTLRCGV